MGIFGMAKNPICGMFVEENENSIQHIREGIKYIFAHHNV